MKKIICLLLATVVLLLSVGCNQQEPSSPTETTPTEPSNETQKSESVSDTTSQTDAEDYITFMRTNLLVPASFVLNPPIEDKNFPLDDIKKVKQGMTMAEAFGIFGMFLHTGSIEYPISIDWITKQDDLSVTLCISFAIEGYEDFWEDLNSGKYRLPNEEVLYDFQNNPYATQNEMDTIRDFYLNAKAISASVAGILGPNHSVCLFTSNSKPNFPTNVVMPKFRDPCDRIGYSSLANLNDVTAGMTMEKVWDILGTPQNILSLHPFTVTWRKGGIYISVYFKADNYDEFWQRFNNGEFVLPDEEIKYEQYTGKRYATENEIKAYKELYLKSRVIKVEKYENGKTTILINDEN